MIVLASGGMLLAGEGSVLLYAACFAAFWMDWDLGLPSAPTATATYFGAKSYTAAPTHKFCIQTKPARE